MRAALAVLAGVHLWWGGWAWSAPRHFYANFPGLGHRWTAAYPPFNEHLVADLGATFLTLGVLLGLAAAVPDRRSRMIALVAVLCFSILHLIFHVGHGFDPPNAGEYAASLVTLIAGVAAPGVLLLLLVRRRRGADAP
jgi:hypothetical protein